MRDEFGDACTLYWTYRKNNLGKGAPCELTLAFSCFVAIVPSFLSCFIVDFFFLNARKLANATWVMLEKCAGTHSIHFK